MNLTLQIQFPPQYTVNLVQVCIENDNIEYRAPMQQFNPRLTFNFQYVEDPIRIILKLDDKFIIADFDVNVPFFNVKVPEQLKFTLSTQIVKSVIIFNIHELTSNIKFPRAQINFKDIVQVEVISDEFYGLIKKPCQVKLPFSQFRFNLLVSTIILQIPTEFVICGAQVQNQGLADGTFSYPIEKNYLCLLDCLLLASTENTAIEPIFSQIVKMGLLSFVFGGQTNSELDEIAGQLFQMFGEDISTLKLGIKFGVSRQSNMDYFIQKHTNFLAVQCFGSNIAVEQKSFKKAEVILGGNDIVYTGSDKLLGCFSEDNWMFLHKDQTNSIVNKITNRGLEILVQSFNGEQTDFINIDMVDILTTYVTRKQTVNYILQNGQNLVVQFQNNDMAAVQTVLDKLKLQNPPSQCRKSIQQPLTARKSIQQPLTARKSNQRNSSVQQDVNGPIPLPINMLPPSITVVGKDQKITEAQLSSRVSSSAEISSKTSSVVNLVDAEKVVVSKPKPKNKNIMKKKPTNTQNLVKNNASASQNLDGMVVQENDSLEKVVVKPNIPTIQLPSNNQDMNQKQAKQAISINKDNLVKNETKIESKVAVKNDNQNQIKVETNPVLDISSKNQTQVKNETKVVIQKNISMTNTPKPVVVNKSQVESKTESKGQVQCVIQKNQNSSKDKNIGEQKQKQAQQLLQPQISGKQIEKSSINKQEIQSKKVTQEQNQLELNMGQTGDKNSTDQNIQKLSSQNSQNIQLLVSSRLPQQQIQNLAMEKLNIDEFDKSLATVRFSTYKQMVPCAVNSYTEQIPKHGSKTSNKQHESQHEKLERELNRLDRLDNTEQYQITHKKINIKDVQKPYSTGVKKYTGPNRQTCSVTLPVRSLSPVLKNIKQKQAEFDQELSKPKAVQIVEKYEEKLMQQYLEKFNV